MPIATATRPPMGAMAEIICSASSHRPRLLRRLAAGRDDARTRDDIEIFRSHADDLRRAIGRIPAEPIAATGSSGVAVAAAELRKALTGLAERLDRRKDQR
jgi:hypothetical protein